MSAAQALVSHDFVGIGDSVPQCVLRLVYLSLWGEADMFSLHLWLRTGYP